MTRNLGRKGITMSRYSRRHFNLSLASTGALGLLGAGRGRASGPEPETSTIRLKKSVAICFAPYYILTAVLRAEGFDEVLYLDAPHSTVSSKMIDNGDLHFDLDFAGRLVHDLDNGRKITAIGGVHVGCNELFANDPIRTISDLKGRRIAINELHLG